MSCGVIHVLLFDGSVLCVELKNMKSSVLVNHLCIYLRIKSYDTLGLLYRDCRGLDQWLDESKLISDHDIASHEQIIQLILLIRFIPHHICDDENNIHQMILLASRLLRQDWFLAQPDIHSQLVALYLLFLYGMDLSDYELYSAVCRCNLSTVDPVSKDNHFDSILDAYKIYRDKYDNAVDFSLKFLQLMMHFPVFNSRIFVISNSKGEKFLMGVNSVQMTIFCLDKYHEPLKKMEFKNVENVMHRDIKIIICLKDRQRNVHDELVTYFALSTHQSDSLYQEIESCWNKYKTTTISSTINQLMKDHKFKERLGQRLYDISDGPTYEDYHSKYINIHLIPTDGKDQVNNEQEFGKVKMYDSDIYKVLSQVSNNKVQVVQKPKADYEQLSSEEKRLKSILNEKMNELLENFTMEKELTGIMPVEYNLHFPSGSSRFIRNTNGLNTGRRSHKGCAAEIKNKFVFGDTWAQSRTTSRDNISCHSSSNIKGSISPSVYACRMKTSHSVTDLRISNLSPRSNDERHHYAIKSSGKLSLSPYSSVNSSHTSGRYPSQKSYSPLISPSSQNNINISSSKPTPFVKKSLNNKY